MKAKSQNPVQRTSRTRLAAALCTAGLVAGALGGNLVGAGADNPPVPGEHVAAPPTQLTSAGAGMSPSDVPATTSTTPTTTTPAPTTTATTPADAAKSDAPPATPPADAPAPSGEHPADPTPAPAQAAPATPVPAPAPAAARPPRSTPSTALQPSDAPLPMGELAGAPQIPAAAAAPADTIGTTAAGAARGTVDEQGAAHHAVLRNGQGVPTLANPTTSLALPGPAAIGVPNFFIDKFRIPVFLLPIYQAAGIQYGVRWEVLAAINEIETDYGRNLNVSSAGALGWMQFMPETWKIYGVDANRDGRKDPFNPVDAIFAAARYLRAAGAQDDLRNAIFAYNHADWYVESVLMRARLIGGLPTDLVGSLSGLTQGHFPVYAKARYADDLSEHRMTHRVAAGRNAAMPIEGDGTRRGIDVFAAAGSPVIAVQDGRIVAAGTSKRLGRYVKLADVYGNTYTYARLKKVARRVPVAKPRTQSRASIVQELALPTADPKPTQAATAGRPTHKRPALAVPKAPHAATTAPAKVNKTRLFAHPARKNALLHGGRRQMLEQESMLARGETLKSYFTGAFGLDEKDVVLKPLVPGRRVIAGTILGRIGTVAKAIAPHMLFEIRPSGRGAPRIDPKPILDGWKLLEATAIYRARGTNPLVGASAFSASIGQIMLMSKEALAQRVLSNPRIEIYSCGRRDIEAGVIDRRVLATLEFLAASGMKPTVTSLHCGHGYYTAGGNVSEHSAGSAVDIAMINGIPILGHQGEGSIADMAIRRLLTLQGTMRPHQIISLMTYKDADNTLALSDHADHIHVGFRPEYVPGTPVATELEAVLKPSQWVKLVDRLGQIENPSVAKTPSRYAIRVPVPTASTAHSGE
jgi:murein DD-endopeptidase MepM/ murein hydrolase activator NlpD